MKPNGDDHTHRSWIRWLGMTALLLCAGTRLEPEAVGSVIEFEAATDASIVATTGLSEILGEIILLAKITCGDASDDFCVNEAETLDVHYSNIEIDNTTATGIQVCEILSTNFVCNEPGYLLTGIFTITGDTLSIGVREGANLSAFDRVTIAGVRARIATGVMSTPGLESLATIETNPESAASFPPDTLVAARSALPLSLQITSVPEIPCQEGDALPTLLVTEGYPAAFVDHGDSLERTFPGPPVFPRATLGGNANTRVGLAVSGLAADIEIHWPLTIEAQNSAAVLDLISQSVNGSTATYVYETSSQLQSDELSELFAIRLQPEHFKFSGSQPLSGLVSIQAQLLPGPEEAHLRPRYSHALEPEPGLFYLQMRRCGPPALAVGSARIRATVDGEDWTGSLHVHLEGPASRNSAMAPQTIEDLPSGNYGVSYLSGGPAGAQLADVTPNSVQTIAVNSFVTYTFNFTGPTIANLQLSAMPQVACPSEDTAVGMFQVANVTGDTQIIPAGAALVFTFNSPLDALPVISGFESPMVSSSVNSVRYDLPEGLTLPSGSILTFSGARLDLSGVADGQSITVMLSSIPSEAILLSMNQTVVATTDSEACSPPPSFLSDDITNGASREPGLVAGSISTLSGEHLTDVIGVALAGKIPLPEEIAGTSVTVNGTVAPVFAVANVGGQQEIHFQVPWGIAGQDPATVIVNRKGLESEPVEASLLPVLPGIFTMNGTSGVILHGEDSTLVTPSHPASPEESVTLYAIGLGPVSDAPETGTAALTDPLSTTAFEPVVTVAGLPAEVELSVLAPGFVGLYRVDLKLPPGVPEGVQDVILQVAGQSSKPATIAIQ